jgi:hypothetical protein
MNQPTALKCPSCGAGLGPLEGAQYKCAYCGHLSLPPKPVVDQSQRAQMLQALLGQFEQKRGQARNARDELRQREREAMASGRRTNGYVMLGIGGLFLVFALACFGGAITMLVASGGSSGSSSSASRHHGHSPAPTAGPPAAAAGGPAAFGLFWVALGGGMFYIGVRYMRADRRDKRLRASGIKGSASVKSYKESSMVVDGNTSFELMLEVEVPGRASWVVKQSDYVPHPWAVTTGADLPVFVDPNNPNDVMIDWFTLRT